MRFTPYAVLALTALALSGCPSPAPVTPDAAPADAPPVDAPLVLCTSDAECDDGLFCSGEETCEAGRCTRTPVACDDGIACTTDRCSEERVQCLHDAPDADGDGYLSAACLDSAGDPLGNDCADGDANTYPGNREVCDDHDEDCDPTTLGGTDEDGDGFVSDACCNGTECGDDCDDARDSSYPGGTEVCDGLDQNCDGTADDGVALAGWVDRDRDLWGDATMPLMACADSPGWVPMDRGGDCNDDPADPNARRQNPGQAEICDGVRNDCDDTLAADVGAGAVNWYGDTDGDGFGSSTTSVTSSCTVVPDASLLDTDCNDGRAGTNPAATEACNGIDDDCNGEEDYRIGDNDFEDDDDDDLLDLACPGGTDCNDRDAASGPGEVERCDGRDNDCDSITDEGATSVVYYRDLDADGFGSPASGSVVACMPSAGFVVRAGDCNDADVSRYPGATEACDAADQDCDAAIDETPAALSCSVANTSSAACIAGRCDVGVCATGFEDCNERGADGCEVDTRTSDANCGACGAVCLSGESCVGSSCECDLGSVVCAIGCIDPRRDERFCGAQGSCDDISNDGAVCRVGELCRYGACMRSNIFPGAYAGLMPTRPRHTTYTIDAPGTATIEYTVDGTTPGASPTTMMGSPPIDVVVTTSPTRIRWRARYADGDVEPLQTLTHITDATSRPAMGGEPYSPMPADNNGAIAEHVSINGGGPIAVLAPGAPFTVTADVQYWSFSAYGYCPTCAVYVSINFGGNILTCLGSAYSYPGPTASGATGSGTAPATAGVYPIVVSHALDFDCRPGGGEAIGWIVVDGPLAPPG